MEALLEANVDPDQESPIDGVSRFLNILCYSNPSQLVLCTCEARSNSACSLSMERIRTKHAMMYVFGLWFGPLCLIVHERVGQPFIGSKTNTGCTFFWTPGLVLLHERMRCVCLRHYLVVLNLGSGQNLFTAGTLQLSYANGSASGTGNALCIGTM